MNQNEEQRIHELLCALVLGELEGAERTEIEQLLEENPELQAERARIEATIGLVQDSLATPAAADTLPASALAELRSAAAEASAPVKRTWYALPPVRFAAAAALLASVGFLFVKSRDKQYGDPATTSTEVAFTQDAPDSTEASLRKDAAKSGNERSGGRGGTAQGKHPAPERAEADGASQRRVDVVDEERAREFFDSVSRIGYVVEEADPAAAPAPPPAEADPRVTGADFLDEGELAAAFDFKGKGNTNGEFDYYVAPDSTVTFDTNIKNVFPSGGIEPEGQVDLEASVGLYALKAESQAGNQVVQHWEAPNSTPAPTASANPTPGLASGGKKELERARGKVGYLADSIEAGEDPVEFLRELRKLGYAHADADFENKLDRDDFFLGLGEARRGFESRGQSWEEQVEYILNHCRRLPKESPRDMFFRFWGDNAPVPTVVDRLSTFSVDVDTASYALARKYLTSGHLPTKAQIRTEEFVNYFRPDVAAPVEETFRVTMELAPSLFGDPEHSMLRVTVRGREVTQEERKPLALTFVVDVSGSMKEDQRLELVKHALRLLVAQLDARDAISIVAFSNEARLVLPMTSGANRGLIEAAIYGLNPDGGTNAEAGLKLGYEQAVLGLDEQANNRVVLLSDGVANIGQTDQDRINGDVEAQRALGIYLNTVGVGMDNHNDTFLEQLANKGDGICNYVDDADEVERALVDNFTGAFEPIARDVKIQVEFDPLQVESYRLLGYENRAIADADFRNDAVDAGEVGAGHQVTALYEIVRTATSGEPDGPLATTRVRYKAPYARVGGTIAGRVDVEGSEDAATEIAVSFDAKDTSGAFSGTTPGYRRTVLVAQFAEFLRRSVHARSDSLDTLLLEAEKLAPELADPDFNEFVALAKQSYRLIVESRPKADELLDAIDTVRRNRYLEALYGELAQDEDAALLQELEARNAELEERIRELLRKRVERKVR